MKLFLFLLIDESLESKQICPNKKHIKQKTQQCKQHLFNVS